MILTKQQLRKIKPWQTSISSLVGFAGVIITLGVGSFFNLQMKQEEVRGQAKSVAIGLYFEAITVASSVWSLEQSISYAKRQLFGDKSSYASLPLKTICARFHELVDRNVIGPDKNSKFDDLRSKVGQLPGKLPFMFLNFWRTTEKLNEEIKRNDRSLCEFGSASHFSWLQYDIVAVRRSINTMQRELLYHFPDFRDVPELLKDNATYTPPEPDPEPKLPPKELVTSSITKTEAPPATRIAERRKNQKKRAD